MPSSPSADSVWPLHPRPEVVRGFDLPAKPWLPGHRGLDLAGSPGQPVLSATPGTITYAGPLAGRGVIVVTNGHFRTTYEPVISTLPVGTTVTPGTTIARLSAAGTHCPPRPCLHWGLRTPTTYLNPVSLLATPPIRLLPQPPPSTQHPPAAPPERMAELVSATPRPPHAQRSPDTARQPAAEADGGGELTAGIVVGLAAAAAVGGSLLIRRH